MKRFALAVALLSITACGKKDSADDTRSASGASPASDASCGAAFDHAIALERDGLEKEFPGITDAMIANLKAAAVKRCSDDKWSDDVLHCFTDGKTAEDVDRCDRKLSKDQKEKLDKDIEPVMAAVAKAGSSAAPPPTGP